MTSLMLTATHHRGYDTLLFSHNQFRGKSGGSERGQQGSTYGYVCVLMLTPLKLRTHHFGDKLLGISVGINYLELSVGTNYL